MADKIQISIITPSYNQGKFISETIQSVLSQQGDNFEIEYFVIDGGSTDGTVEILKSYEKKFKSGEFKSVKSFVWISEKDNGQSDAINKGIKMATGEVIAYLNSDDVYQEDALSKVAEFFINNSEAKFVTGKCKIIDEKGTEIRKLITLYKNLSLKYLLSFFWLLSENPISQPATFWKRSLHDELGYFSEDEHLVMDYEFWLRVGQNNKYFFLDENLASFRWYMTSKSGDRFIEQFKREYEISKKYSEKTNHYLSIVLHKLNYWKIVLVYWMMGIKRIKE